MPQQEVARVQAERVLPPAKTTEQNVSQKELEQSIEQIQVMMDLRNWSVEFLTMNPVVCESSKS